MAKDLLCATRMAERSLLSWCDRRWTSLGSANQSIEELKTGILKHN